MTEIMKSYLYKEYFDFKKNLSVNKFIKAVNYL